MQLNRKDRKAQYRKLAETHITGKPDIRDLCRAFFGYVNDYYQDGDEIPQGDLASMMSLMVNVADFLGDEMTAYAFAKKAEMEMVETIEQMVKAQGN